VSNCKQNITVWESRIAELKLQIQEYESRIAEEKVKCDKIQEETTVSTQEEIAEKARQGLKYFSASEAIGDEIQSLIDSDKVLDIELGSVKNFYNDLKSKM
jgi:chromosome segregation ATPase